ncbi:DUF6795 domain-containing protein [Psychromonas sp.]|uniref:DUF6795 domain-containing protein n=1 Tax=Psychromonas sp. TaxID=1884585 RepID=UPI0039E4F09E
MKKHILLILLLIFSYGVTAVSIKQCLFSEMTGVVNFEGKPAAGVKLVRMVDYNKAQYDETVTDENGKFHFSPIYRSSLLSAVLPMEFVVAQKITAFYDGKEYEMWSGTKRKSEENSEARGKPLHVSCELTLPELNFIIVERSPIFSLCTWDVEADPDDRSSLFG